jgi:hypothetical protein
MQFLELIDYGPDLSEPIKKVVEILKVLTKMSVEDTKTTQNALNGGRTAVDFGCVEVAVFFVTRS